MLKERILTELKAIGFARATDFLYTRGDELVIRSTEELSQDDGAAIAAIERSANGLKVKFYDKLKALELLGKSCGLFEGNDASDSPNNLLEAILEASGKEMKLDAIPEAQSAAAAGNDMVESPQAEA